MTDKQIGNLRRMGYDEDEIEYDQPITTVQRVQERKEEPDQVLLDKINSAYRSLIDHNGLIIKYGNSQKRNLVYIKNRDQNNMRHGDIDQLAGYLSKLDNGQMGEII